MTGQAEPTTGHVVKRLIHLLIIAACYFYIMPAFLGFLLMGLESMGVEKQTSNLIVIHNLRPGLVMLLIGWLAWVVYGLATAIPLGGRKGQDHG